MDENLQADIDAMAVRIRELYIQERTMHESQTGRNCGFLKYESNPMWDGGSIAVYGNKGAGKRECKPIWPKIAEFVLRNSLDPDRFIRSQFFNLGRNRPPAPNHLLSQNAVARYRNWREMCAVSEQEVLNSRTSGEAIYKLQLNDHIALFSWPRSDSIKSILLDETLEMSVLLRYCLAKQEKVIDVAKHYFRAAAWQYCRDRELYDQHWADLLPQGFAERALAVYGYTGESADE